MFTRKSFDLGLKLVLIGTLSLQAAACLDSSAVEAAEAIRLQVSADSLVADGFSAVSISVELPRSLPQDPLVEISTSVGRLISAAGAPDRKVAVRAHEGRAEVRLISAGEVGTAYITASGAGSTAQATLELTPSLPDSIDLFVDRIAAPADGATAVTATAVLRRVSGVVTKGVPVRFEARDSLTQSVLLALSGVVLTDGEGAAKFKLITTVPGTVQVRGFVGAVGSGPRMVHFTTPPTTAVPATLRFPRDTVKSFQSGGSR